MVTKLHHSEVVMDTFYSKYYGPLVTNQRYTDTSIVQDRLITSVCAHALCLSRENEGWGIFRKSMFAGVH